jgi:5'-methylthioadenosine phosphorylase
MFVYKNFLMEAEVGIIGGTGVYDPDLLEDAKPVDVKTPFGDPSDRFTVGVYEGKRVAILPRHGSDHSIPPHKINFRANIWALKELGCSRILATCACGSLKEELKPGDMVFPDQFIDLSKSVHTFYDEGKFYHVGMADPFCSELRGLLVNKANDLGINNHNKVTYLKIDGPQFSTRAASNMYRNFAGIIGMTGVPEAILTREKEMCFAIIATVTDYDSWIGKATDFSEMKQIMAKNLENTKRVLKAVIPEIPDERNCICKDALKGAEA